MLWVAPPLAVGLTVLSGMVLFAMLGADPVLAARAIFVEPFLTAYSRSELLVKATPLILIAIGLALGFRANVWNIGAEGQFIMGAVAGGAVGLAFYDQPALWLLPLMCVAGAAAGLAWGLVPAVLKIRFNTSEILVSLMLVYVADLFLSVMVNGPLRDPDGFNFPESRLFHDSALLPILIPGGRAHAGVLAPAAAVLLAAFLLHRHRIGFQIQLYGQAPRAARFAGFDHRFAIAFCLGVSGGLAGLAGVIETAGPVGQLIPALPVGFGFTAIIVAFLGRLNPFGIVLAGAILALTYIGGEIAQVRIGLPSAAISVFQGMLLFFLLGIDLLINYRIRPTPRGAT